MEECAVSEDPDLNCSCVSLRTNQSRDVPLLFRTEKKFISGTRTRPGPEPGSGPEQGRSCSCVSLRSSQSRDVPLLFSPEKKSTSDSQGQRPELGPGFGPCPCCVSLKRRGPSESSRELKLCRVSSLQRPGPGQEPGCGPQQNLSSSLPQNTHLDSVFQLLETNVVEFVRRKLKWIKKVVMSGDEENEKEGKEEEKEGEEEEKEGEEEEERQRRRISRDAVVNISLDFLRSMKEEELAETLQSRVSAEVGGSQLRSQLRSTFQFVSEGVARAWPRTPLQQVYTELYVTEALGSEVNQEHEVRRVETSFRRLRPDASIRCEDIFKPRPGLQQPIRTVLTRGVAGIGKTVLTHKFVVDWAERRAHAELRYVFPLSFRELNLMQGAELSLLALLHRFFPHATAGAALQDEASVVFILDGLDECRLPLDFQRNCRLSDVAAAVALDVLLTSLIVGTLLPRARLWITSRPAAAGRIPPHTVDLLTEIRGFSDEQKDEFFRRRFRKEAARRVLSHIRASRSLFIMCHIPVFCWITATVMQDALQDEDTPPAGDTAHHMPPDLQTLPSTLTQMYIHFLVVQLRRRSEPEGCGRSLAMVTALGRLAWEQLLRGKLLFYESDLQESGVQLQDAALYSGVFTQMFREERGLVHDRVFCFVHLSVQEFLAALYVHATFSRSGRNVLEGEQTAVREGAESGGKWAGSEEAEPVQRAVLEEKGVEPVDRVGSEKGAESWSRFYQSAVDQALQSADGHLDLFLRFLLGLSLTANQRLLRWLLPQTEGHAHAAALAYVRRMVEQTASVERSINLFHCLNELQDRVLLEQIQQSLRCGKLAAHMLSPAHWAALVFILLSSAEDLNSFNLKKFIASEDALLRLLPVVQASSTAVLSGCNLTGQSCSALSVVLGSASCRLRDLDLSNNDLQDGGVKLLCEALRRPDCRLQTLRLSGCLVTSSGCAALAAALDSNPDHLRELDLSYNHPGVVGAELLTAGLHGQRWKLEALKLEPAGAHWLGPGLRKYACVFSLDRDTVHRRIRLSEAGCSATYLEEEQLYPERPERFDRWPQVLSSSGLTGRCYWEVAWTGETCIALSYGAIRRKGDSEDCEFGGSDQSWSLNCFSGGRHTAWHSNTGISMTAPSTANNRVGVYLDWGAGLLSFYRVCPHALLHLHTFNTSFSQPLFPGFGFEFWSSSGSSVTLCHLSPEEQQEEEQGEEQEED